MDISLLKGVNKICVHDNCPDGTASAIILKEALDLGPEQIVFVQHDALEYKEMKAEPVKKQDPYEVATAMVEAAKTETKLMELQKRVETSTKLTAEQKKKLDKVISDKVDLLADENEKKSKK